MDDLRRIDLNLLLTLQALLAEKHVTRAALRLYKSQPAVSHALAQLRDIFQDPLLIRQGGGMALTPRARELQQPLEAALGQLNALLHKGEFDASRAVRRFRVALSDYAAHLLLPPLLRQLRAQAPGIDMAISQASREAMLAQLADGEIDLALGVFPDAPGDIKRETLFEEHFVSVADRRSLPPGATCRCRNGWSAPRIGRDAARRRKRDRRRAEGAGPAPACRPDAAALERVDGSAGRHRPDPDGCQQALANVASGKALRQFKPPFDLPPFSFQQAWHGRRDSDPALCWLRSVVISCC